MCTGIEAVIKQKEGKVKEMGGEIGGPLSGKRTEVDPM